MTFSDLNLIKPLLAALDQMGYIQPTPIQQQSIPHILNGRDILGSAQTGTGKTAAFSLPILQMLSSRQQNAHRKQIKALILVPTRELALQISANIHSYNSQLHFSHTTVVGGIPQSRQVNDLKKGVDILIATPGRLLDLMQQGYVDLRSIEFFVLDEADRMLDMGFINDIKKVIAKLPAKKQTLFFSATAPPDIMKLANTLLKDPVKISVSPQSSTSDLIQQSVYQVSKENKRSLLRYILKDSKIEHALVFTRTKRGADRVAKELNMSGIKAAAIHGNKSQGARERALDGFKNRTVKILVATDIASRGIDVEKLTHVINFEIPEQAETYVHRIGRTGRAGSKGIALSLCAQDEMPYLKDIHKLIKKNIDVVASHPYM
jgi:ATP-dependent RNA helicase RhlE